MQDEVTARRLERSDRSGGSATGGDKAIAGEVGENMHQPWRGHTSNLIVSGSEKGKKKRQKKTWRENPIR